MKPKPKLSLAYPSQSNRPHSTQTVPCNSSKARGSIKNTEIPCHRATALMAVSHTQLAHCPAEAHALLSLGCTAHGQQRAAASQPFSWLQEELLTDFCHCSTKAKRKLPTSSVGSLISSTGLSLFANSK